MNLAIPEAHAFDKVKADFFVVGSPAYDGEKEQVSSGDTKTRYVGDGVDEFIVQSGN